MRTANLCQICNKPYAYALPGNAGWYTPPAGPYPPSTAITITTTTGTSTDTGWLEVVARSNDYCYGHSFTLCAECGCQVAWGWHTPAQCSILRGMMEGLRQVAAHIERQETMPADERLDVPVEVPDVFHEAFKEIERL